MRRLHWVFLYNSIDFHTIYKLSHSRSCFKEKPSKWQANCDISKRFLIVRIVESLILFYQLTTTENFDLKTLETLEK